MGGFDSKDAMGGFDSKAEDVAAGEWEVAELATLRVIVKLKTSHNEEIS